MNKLNKIKNRIKTQAKTITRALEVNREKIALNWKRNNSHAAKSFLADLLEILLSPLRGYSYVLSTWQVKHEPEQPPPPVRCHWLCLPLHVEVTDCGSYKWPSLWLWQHVIKSGVIHWLPQIQLSTVIADCSSDALKRSEGNKPDLCHCFTAVFTRWHQKPHREEEKIKPLWFAMHCKASMTTPMTFY